MPLIADYKVISDPGFKLQLSGDTFHDFEFTLDNSADLSIPAILTFVVTVTPNAMISVLEVKINPAPDGSSPESYNYSSIHGGPTSYMLQEVIDKNLKKGSGLNGLNKARFRILPGMGALKITDVVLHFHRNV